MLASLTLIMAESKPTALVPLSGSNYPTWKVQCRMALMKDGLWGIVNGTEHAPGEDNAQAHSKFMTRRDRALAVIVLSIEPSLLYLIGEPDNPITVWGKLSDQFQRRTWANKLELRRKLYSLRLKEGQSVQSHIKAMTEVFDALSVVGDPMEEEDRVVHLLASLPESFNMLVTALEANPDVPTLETVTERLLHEERKAKDRGDGGASNEKEKAMYGQQKKVLKCHNCGKVGHLKRYCWSLRTDGRKPKPGKGTKHKANKAGAGVNDSNSGGDSEALIACHALSANSTSNWIVDSGATCHMCSDDKLFANLQRLEKPVDVTLGDGRALMATSRGTVSMEMKLPNNKTRRCKLLDVLYVPNLSYNLLSVSKAAEAGKVTNFDDIHCQIFDSKRKLIAVATRIGSLYYLNCKSSREQASPIKEESKENMWHRRFGHLGVQNLQRLARDKLVDGFDFNPSKEVNFCETCTEGKHHRSPFPTNGGSRAKEPLGLVHSDVCGKMNTRSLGGAEYFLTFIDDMTHYTWIYVLKSKDEVFKRFVEWKSLVERSSGRKLKVLRSDNGGEYTSTKFQDYLKSEGISHQRTVPKTPEQNGVAERMNRTLVETIRSMLVDAKLPHKFWAEALSTAVYLKNRSPTKALKNMTPYEAWTKEKPKVEHLRVFGCDAYAHVAKDERQKLDSKSRKCIFLGYGTETKGYRLYDPSRLKVFFSRDVRFNERRRESSEQEPAKQEQQRYVELEYSSEPELIPEDRESDMPPEREAEPVLRRSERERRPTDFYGERINVARNEPVSLEEALNCPDKRKWLTAMEKEMESLRGNEVWDLVELPKDRTPVGSKWVFKLKTGTDGSIERYKARLVAQGFTQKFGTDYDETFSPVVRIESLRTLIALAVKNGLQLHQADVTTAFLNGQLEEEVYMKQPKGFVQEGQEHLVCKLKRSIYGLKQSSRCWNSTLDSYLKQMGFVQTESDPCIYRNSGGDVLIGVYVDDMVFAGKNEKQLEEVKKTLAKRFDIKDMGKLHHFLGMKIVQNDQTGEVWMGQPLYTENLLQKFGMENAKPVSTPVDSNSKLVKATEDEDRIDQQLYQSAVGSLLFLSVGTRPDIAYAVSNVAKFSSQPTKKHWSAVKRIMRYLKGTVNFGLHYSKESPEKCVGYSDADWGGDLDDRKSTSGYLFQISGGPVSWRSKKQTSVALSTAEAEYMALASAGQEAVWMRLLIAELCDNPVRAVTILEDNQAAIQMTRNPQFHGRTKHIGIKFHFIRDLISDGTVNVEYCPTQQMIADMLTKGLPREQFNKLRDMAGIKPMPGCK